jgi:hypothetical protein
MTEQENRRYAASLLNRADVAFDVRDLAMVAKVVELVERDVAALIERYAAEVEGLHSVAPSFVRTVASLIAEGRHRPELHQEPVVSPPPPRVPRWARAAYPDQRWED